MTDIEPIQDKTLDQRPAVQKFLEREEKDLYVQYWKQFIINDTIGNQIQAIPPQDDQRFIPLEFKVVVEGGHTYTFDLQSSQGLSDLQKGLNLEETCKYHCELTFIINKEAMLGLTFKITTKTLRIFSSSQSFDLGSYPPTNTPITKVIECSSFKKSGLSYYSIEDSQGNVHFNFEMKLNFVKP